MRNAINKTDYGVLFLFLIAGIFLTLYWGKQKSVFFCDEIYTYESANAVEKESIFSKNQKWITGEDINSYYAATDKNVNVYGINAALYTDHVPLYFYLFRIFSIVFFFGQSSKWIGLWLNCVFFVILCGFLYYIGRLLLGRFNAVLFVAICCFCHPVMISQLTTIRMYLMLTLCSVVAIASECKILKDKKTGNGSYVCLYIATLTGLLTHFYFWLYLAFLSVGTALCLIIRRQWKKLKACAITAIVSLTSFAILFRKGIFNLLKEGQKTGFGKAIDFSSFWGNIGRGISTTFYLLGGRGKVPIYIIIFLAALIIGMMTWVMFQKKQWEYLVNYYIILVAALLYSIYVGVTAFLKVDRYFWLPSSLILFLLIFSVFYLLKSGIDILMKRMGNKEFTIIGRCCVIAVFAIFTVLFMDLQEKGENIENLRRYTIAEEQMIENVSDQPWLIYHNGIDPENVFQWEKGGEICFVEEGSKPKKDNVLVENDKYILWVKKELLESAMAYLENSSGKVCSCELLLEKSNGQIFQIYSEY